MYTAVASHLRIFPYLKDRLPESGYSSSYLRMVQTCVLLFALILPRLHCIRPSLCDLFDLPEKEGGSDAWSEERSARGMPVELRT